MSTILGVECADGAVLAADRTVVRGGSVRSTSKERVFEVEGGGAAVLDDGGDAFRRRLEKELRSYAMERGPASLEALVSVAVDVAEAESVGALVAGREEGIVRLRAVHPDGAVTEESYDALGSGAPVALGRLEGEDLDVGFEAAEELVRSALAAVAERDAETGGGVDVLRVANGEK